MHSIIIESMDNGLSMDLDALITRVMNVEDKTLGSVEQGFVVRYRGRLMGEDTVRLYDWLEDALRPYQLTPVFRMEDRRHVVYFIPAQPQPKPSSGRLNLILFILTLISVIYTGGAMSITQEPPPGFIPGLMAYLSAGWPFAVAILSIMGAHEFGHYLMGRYHNVHVSLPYFIPFPNVFGTLGAVINMKERVKNRRVLLDIGIAGPLSGLVVSLLVLGIGLSLSNLSTLPPAPPQLPSEGGFFQQFLDRLTAPVTLTLEGNSILYLLMKYLRFGMLLPAPADYGGVPPVLYWIRYFFTASPPPYGGVDVSLHPVAWAGWGGLLITALNLIPAGTLDGGHLINVLIGRKRAMRLLPWIQGILLAMSLLSINWLIWLLLISWLGKAYAEPLDEITPLDPPRKALAVLGIIIFFLVFSPVPISGM